MIKSNEIKVIYGDKPYEMTMELLEAAGLSDLIKQGSSIGIKPNFVNETLPSQGATTHPEIVAAIIDYLQKNGHKNLLVLEGSWIGSNTDRAMKYIGYDTMLAERNVPFLNTKFDKFVTKESGGIKMEISKTALELDYLINVPVLKGHCQTLITGALKNLKGIISDNEKRHFHTLGLHKPIAHLNKLICADFVVLDGICGDLDFEEGGNPVQMNRIACCTDSVLIDSYEANTMGYEADEIEYIYLANKLGIGSSDIANAQITELNHDSTIASGRSTRKIDSLKRYIDEQDACSACYANLIRALYRAQEEGKLNRDLKISIGQAFKGKTGECGVGNCTKEFKKSVPGCPARTLDIYKALFE